MSAAESLGSHSLNSFADYLQIHLESPGACSYLRTPVKPLSKPMVDDKPVKKGGKKRQKNTAKDLPPALYEQYKSDEEETYTQRKNRIQWI